MPPFGSTDALLDNALSVRLAPGLSTSATVRLIVPANALTVLHDPPATTTTVGGSFTGVTVSDTVTVFESAPLGSRAL